MKCCVIVSEYETVDNRKEVIPNGQFLGHHTVASGSMLRILIVRDSPLARLTQANMFGT